MTTALITGASGFIGGHLAEALLQQGTAVRCLVRRSSSVEHLPRDQVELTYGDLREPSALEEAIRGVDTVYHLAAMTSALRYDDMLAVNAGGSERIAEACAAQPTPPVLVAMSSLAAAGPISRGEIRTEEDPPAPISNYGRSKLAGEEACRKFAAEVPTTVVRAAIVFGPRNKEMLPMFQSLKRFRLHAAPGFRTPPLSYVYVTDLVELMLQCAARGERLPAEPEASGGQGIYFAAADEHPTWAELGQIVKPMMDRPFAPIVRLPISLSYCFAGINELAMRLRGKPDSFNLDKIREASASSWACSGEKAQRALGIAPQGTLEERLAETVVWYKEAGWL